MTASAQRQLRTYSLVLLGMSVVMLVGGLTFLKPHLTGWVFVVYWLACLTITCAVIIVSMLELAAIRRDARRAHRALFMESMRDITPTGSGNKDNKTTNEKNSQ